MSKLLLVLMLLNLFVSGCLGSSSSTTLQKTNTPVPPLLLPTQTATTPPLTATTVPTATGTMPPSVTAEVYGCQKPQEDYTRIEINGSVVNQRTLAMLFHAQELYGGEIVLTGDAITQGSYTDAVSASFGTHQGGGAVDLSVMRPGTYTVLWDDIEPLLHALRVAGFAAWLRDYGELYPDSPIHIHAIAIGDQELSSAAREQLTGPSGYFRGHSGLPVPENGVPSPDRFGGPILCQWMIDLGYRDLR